MTHSHTAAIIVCFSDVFENVILLLMIFIYIVNKQFGFEVMFQYNKRLSACLKKHFVKLYAVFY